MSDRELCVSQDGPPAEVFALVTEVVSAGVLCVSDGELCVSQDGPPAEVFVCLSACLCVCLSVGVRV